MTLEEIAARILAPWTRADALALYAELEAEGDALSRVQAVMEDPRWANEGEVIHFAGIVASEWMRAREREVLAFGRAVATGDWTSHAESVLGQFQGFGRPEDIPFLVERALASLETWFERDDETQAYFRKCAFAIGAIGARELGTTQGMDALRDLADRAPSFARPLVIEQLNLHLGARSPYTGEDEGPVDMDHDWPGNAKASVLLHPIRARHDDDTVTVFQAYSDQIGQAAAQNGTLAVPGFSTERMTWIKPSFLWAMYRSDWGRKDAQQSTILRITLDRACFYHLIAKSALSAHHPETGQDHATWKAEVASTPNRIQWDPDRDLHIQPMERRALQLGIGAPMVGFYLNQAIKRIENITPLCHEILALRDAGDEEAATRLLPIEAVIAPKDRRKN